MSVTNVTDVTANVTLLAAGQKPDKKRTGPSKRRTSTERDILKAVRAAERTAGDGRDISGTGHTILKMRQKPVERLVNEGRIGTEELQAAEEITAAFTAITSAVAVRSNSLERVDSCGGSGLPPSAQMARKIKRFQQWAHHWTRRGVLLGDPMLAVIIAAVIDEQPVRQIAADVSRRYETVDRAIVAGLRDYAAHAEFVTGGRAHAWRNAAAQVFTAVHPKLAGAIHRGRVEI